MARPRILLTHTPLMRDQYYGTTALDQLKALSDVVQHEGSDPISDNELRTAAAGCDLIIADRNTPFPAERISAIADATAILRVAVDIRNIDVAAASTAGILVTQASRSWVAAVSELTIGLMIDAGRGITAANLAYKQAEPAKARRGLQLDGSTAGIIGYGPLGRRVAELCVAFGMTVLVHDPYVSGVEAPCQIASLDDLLCRADFVLPLAVATPETENLIGARALSRMKPTAFLINVSRGNLVDEDALIAALDGRKIAGAALDVGRADDQMPSMTLARRTDVTATPHMAGLTQPAIEGQALETVLQAAAILAGRMPPGSVNADKANRVLRFAR